jgi:hypothetical protein
MQNPDDIWLAPAPKLAELISAAEGPVGDFEETDLASMFAHELDADLAIELSLGHDSPGLSGASTFRELFAQQKPPLRLLQLTRAHAERLLTDPNSGVWQEIARVLHLASIVTARTWYGISSAPLTEVQMRHEIQWCLDQPWVDNSLKGMFREALQQYCHSGHLSRN